MQLSGGSLGLKLNLALLFFFIILGGLTAAFILYGFNRTQDNATARSQEGLEELGKLALLGVVAGQADYGGLALESAAEMGFRAGVYLQDFEQAAVETHFDTSRLVKNENGVTYDPDPNRITDLAMPNYVELTDDVIEEIEFSSALDAIIPALMTSMPDSVREENFDPIAFSFIGVNNTVRYYPPVNVYENVPPDLDLSTLAKRLGPEGNAERKTLWQAPYEDSAGQGLIMTVEMPVYDGDEYKGAFQIDLSLEKLVAQVDLLKLTSIGFAFYMDSRGDLIETEAKPLLDSEVDSGNDELTAILAAMRSGETGVTRVTVGADEMFIGYAPVEGIGGSLAVAASVEELTASASAITAGIDDEGRRTLRVTLLAMGTLFVVGLMGATYLNRRVLIRPIEALLAGTRAVAQGDYTTRIAVTGDDELAALGHSFNQMTGDIQREVQDREATQQELAALFAAMTDAVVVVDSAGRYVRVPTTNAPAILIPPEDLPGKYMRDVMPEGQAELFLRFVREALIEQQTATIEYPLEIGEATYWFSAAISPISDREVVVVARDITERVNARQELERQVEERTRELTTLLTISNDVASTLELRPLLHLLMGQIKTVVDHWRARLFLLEGEALLQVQLEDPEATAGQGPLEQRPLPLADLQPLWEELTHGRPVIIDDVRDDSEMARVWQRATSDRPQAVAQTQSFLAVPLTLKSQTIGMLTLSHPEKGFYGAGHARLLMAVGSQTAVAVENARLYGQARELAAVEERQRLARELHDSVSQALYGIALGARTARTLLDTDAAKAVEPMDYVLQLADAGLAEMRALIFELRPESLEAEGLVAALEKQIAATRARYGLEVTAVLGEEPDLTLAEKEVFYRVAQEALHNIVKHAHASHVDIALSTQDGGVRLEVRDNGRGFDASQSYPGHMGLVSFTERATSIDATVVVESSPGTGTTVRLTLIGR